MEKLLLKRAAIQSVALMLCVVMLSFAIKQYNEVVILASYNEEIESEDDLLNEEVNQEVTTIIEAEDLDKVEDVEVERARLIFTGANTDLSNEIIEQLGEQYLIIRKPQGEGLQVHLEDLYITRQLRVVVSGFLEENPDVNFIGRVNEEDIFIGEPQYIEIETIEDEEDGTNASNITRDYGKDPLSEILITSSIDDLKYSTYEFILQLDYVYVHTLYEDDYYYYIDLKRPNDMYDKVLVIDAGHGGKDPGAISKDGRTYEKEINIKIQAKLKELLDQDNIKVYYTKLRDETLFLRPRVTLANDVDSDFFISIHCNSNNFTSPNGTEIYYYNNEFKSIKTKDMAKIFSEELSHTVSIRNNGIYQMKDDDIFILNKAKVPAIIIETGYMSNLGDLTYLKSESGQAAIAKGIYNGIWRAYEELID